MERIARRVTAGALRRAVFALAVVPWACATPPPKSPEPGFVQEALATEVRTILTGDVRPEQQEALSQVRGIDSGAISANLRSAMTEAFAYVSLAGGSGSQEVRRTLEDLLAPLYSPDELAAALSGIPSRPGPTAEETTAALLAARLPASDASDTLRAALNQAVSTIAGDMYPYSLHRRVLTAALAALVTDDDLAQIIGSIETVPLTYEQAAAIGVANRHWGSAVAPRADDLPGRDLRSAMIGAVERLSGIHNPEESEIERLGVAGDRPGQERIWRQRRERWPRGASWRGGLSQVLGTIGDTLALPALATAAPASTLVSFGEAAIPHAVGVLRHPSAHREQKRSLLLDLAKIASGPLTAENRQMLVPVVEGFLNGETLGAKRLPTDGQGRVIESAIDLALALRDSALAEILERLAADPGELVRFGVAPQKADELVWGLRERIGWSPEPRSPEQLLAVLRTIPSSPRPSLSHREAAVKLEGMPADEIDDELRSAMIEAWAYTRSPSVERRWYHVRTPLTDVLFAQYSPADVARHVGAFIGGESGPEQDLAIEAVGRWRDETPEDVRVALIEALEHLNRGARDTGRPAYRSQHHSLASAVSLLDDPRAVPALIRAGTPLTCGWTTPALYEVSVEEMARAVVEDAAPGWLVAGGLQELGYISVRGGLGTLPERIRALILASANHFLEGEQPSLSPSVTAEDRIAILKAALYLAVAAGDERLSDRVNRLATDVAAVEALGLGRTEASEVSAHARELLESRPLMGLWDC